MEGCTRVPPCTQVAIPTPTKVRVTLDSRPKTQGKGTAGATVARNTAWSPRKHDMSVTAAISTTVVRYGVTSVPLLGSPTPVTENMASTSPYASAAIRTEIAASAPVRWPLVIAPSCMSATISAAEMGGLHERILPRISCNSNAHQSASDVRLSFQAQGKGIAEVTVARSTAWCPGKYGVSTTAAATTMVIPLRCRAHDISPQTDVFALNGETRASPPLQITYSS